MKNTERPHGHHDGNGLMSCPDCQEQFHCMNPVWHCPVCDHHWDHKGECGNCHAFHGVPGTAYSADTEEPKP